VTIGIAIGVLSILWVQKQKTGTTATAAATDFDPALRGEQLAKLYPAVYEVAANFICPCGSCTDGLEVCDCEMERGASEVRMFIYRLLQVHQPAHAIEIVAEKYNHRKDSAPSSLKFEQLPPPAPAKNPPRE
jgi:hypothetical protein